MSIEKIFDIIITNDGPMDSVNRLLASLLHLSNVK